MALDVPELLPRRENTRARLTGCLRLAVGKETESDMLASIEPPPTWAWRGQQTQIAEPERWHRVCYPSPSARLMSVIRQLRTFAC